MTQSNLSQNSNPNPSTPGQPSPAKPVKKSGPRKSAAPRDRHFTINCSLIERTAIEGQARSVGLTVSEYARQMALKGKIDRPLKVMPKEVLQLMGVLFQLTADLDQIAKKRVSNEELNALERANLQDLVQTLRELVREIKSYLK